MSGRELSCRSPQSQRGAPLARESNSPPAGRSRSRIHSTRSRRRSRWWRSPKQAGGAGGATQPHPGASENPELSTRGGGRRDGGGDFPEAAAHPNTPPEADEEGPAGRTPMGTGRGHARHSKDGPLLDQAAEVGKVG